MTIPTYPHDDDDLRRFFARVQKGGVHECWPWTGATFDARGYGVFTLKRRAVRAHRFIWYAVNQHNATGDDDGDGWNLR